VQPLCNCCATALQPLCNRCATAVQLLCNRCATALLSLCNCYEIAVKSLCNRCATALQPLCFRFVIALQLLCNRYAIIVHSLCNPSTIALKALWRHWPPMRLYSSLNSTSLLLFSPLYSIFLLLYYDSLRLVVSSHVYYSPLSQCSTLLLYTLINPQQTTTTKHTLPGRVDARSERLQRDVLGSSAPLRGQQRAVRSHGRSHAQPRGQIQIRQVSPDPGQLGDRELAGRQVPRDVRVRKGRVPAPGAFEFDFGNIAAGATTRLCQFWAYFLARLLRNHCIIAMQSLHNRFEITAQSLRYCAITAQSLRNRCEIAAKSLRNCCAITAQSLCNHCKIAARSLRNNCEIATQSLYDHCAIAAKLPRNRCAVAP
jgi:hypothetical protein